MESEAVMELGKFLARAPVAEVVGFIEKLCIRRPELRKPLLAALTKLQKKAL